MEEKYASRVLEDEDILPYSDTRLRPLSEKNLIVMKKNNKNITPETA